MMARVFVSVGSNIDRAANIRSGIRSLRERYGDLALSSVYESRPVGFEGKNFYNLVVAFDAADEVHAVAAALRDIETRHGRQRSCTRFSPRTLDLDLLLYDDLILHAPGLELPRDEIVRNAFVLRPLAELAAERHHPLTGQTFTELWQAFDQSRQALWPIDFPWGD